MAITDDFLRSRRRHRLSVEERAALEAAVERTETLPARSTIIRRGEKVRRSTLLVSGAMCRYLDARDGYRQLVAYQVPGDFVDLHGMPLERLDHDVATITACEVAFFSHDSIRQLTERFPNLGRLMWFSTLLEGAMHREWIFRLGRLDAVGRIAHFLAETESRLAAVGRVEGGQFALPLTQQDLGEACGLTSVHVNRTLRRLREEQVAEVGQGSARVLDRDRLRHLGEFDPDYLYCEEASSDAL